MFSWGKPFIFKSKPFDWNDTVYYHQLLEGYPFVPKYQDLSDIYEEFDTLAHATCFKSLGEIFEEGVIKPQFVKDSSVCNPERMLCSLSGGKAKVGLHPLARSKIVWYGPYTKEKAKDQTESIERYGNVMFSLKGLKGYEGIIRESLNHYLVEVIHYRKRTATRILVTNKEYPTLQKYDPYTKGGPWYYDKVNDKHWCLKKAIHYPTNEEVRNTVEFMKDEIVSDIRSKWWLMNHELSYKQCFNSRTGVDASNDINESVLRLVLGTIAYKQMRGDTFEVKMPSCIQFVEMPDDVYLQVCHSLKDLRSVFIPSQKTHNAVQDVDECAQENSDGVDAMLETMLKTHNAVQDVDECAQEDSDGADAMLEIMLNSKYREIGRHLLKINNLFRTKMPFRYVYPKEFRKALLIFFRQEFFDLQQPLEKTFEAILQFLGPDEIPTFFTELESLIKSTKRRMKEVSY